MRDTQEFSHGTHVHTQADSFDDPSLHNPPFSICLIKSNIPNIHVIDLDTIDVTNLNRQFLFRESDIGKSKAQVAAQFINRRCPWMRVEAHMGKIQDKDISFYRSFHCIISGLDNIEARRWLNATIHSLVKVGPDGMPDPMTIIPFIDGGTEGFKGQARLILPQITSCFQCSVDLFPPQKTFPLCTIAETPRLPEHCIQYASEIQWQAEFKDRKFDTDSPSDMQWIYEKALERSQQYQIPGVTYMLTLGVIKNIIPAVASTNAIIAAACVNEAIKVISYCSQSLNTYMSYVGSLGIYSYTYEKAKEEKCPLCHSIIKEMTISRDMSLNEFLQALRDGDLQLKKPSVTAVGKTLYMQRPPDLEMKSRSNLDKSLSSLIQNGAKLTVTDKDVFPGKDIFISIFFEPVNVD